MDDVQRDGVDHVLNNHTQHRVRTSGLGDTNNRVFNVFQHDGVDHVLTYYTQHRVRTPGLREQTQHTFGAEL